jgi:hypothetical protein
MRRVRLLLQMAGDRDGQPWPAVGTEIDLSETEARCLVVNGYARYVTASVDTERAVALPVMETAAITTRRRTVALPVDTDEVSDGDQ